MKKKKSPVVRKFQKAADDLKKTNERLKVEYRKMDSLTDLIMAAGPAPTVVERIVIRDGKDVGVTLSGTRLLPNQVMEMNILLEGALPPELPPEKPGGPPRYDFRNPDYLRQKTVNQRIARAYALIAAFPIFATAFKATPEGAKPKPTHEAMFNFVENLPLEDDLLESAYQQLVKCVVQVDWDRVVFTSAGNSPKS